VKEVIEGWVGKNVGSDDLVWWSGEQLKFRTAVRKEIDKEYWHSKNWPPKKVRITVEVEE
jgi:hypothetical protein